MQGLYRPSRIVGAGRAGGVLTRSPLAAQDSERSEQADPCGAGSATPRFPSSRRPPGAPPTTPARSRFGTVPARSRQPPPQGPHDSGATWGVERPGLPLPEPLLPAPRRAQCRLLTGSRRNRGLEPRAPLPPTPPSPQGRRLHCPQWTTGGGPCGSSVPPGQPPQECLLWPPMNPDPVGKPIQGLAGAGILDTQRRISAGLGRRTVDQLSVRRPAALAGSTMVNLTSSSPTMRSSCSGLILVGGSRVWHLRYVLVDPVLALFAGLRRLPAPRTVSAWLQRLGEGDVERLTRLNSHLVAEDLVGRRRLTPDVDGSVVSTGLRVEGARRGFNPHHREGAELLPDHRLRSAVGTHRACPEPAGQQSRRQGLRLFRGGVDRADERGGRACLQAGVPHGRGVLPPGRARPPRPEEGRVRDRGAFLPVAPTQAGGGSDALAEHRRCHELLPNAAPDQALEPGSPHGALPSQGRPPDPQELPARPACGHYEYSAIVTNKRVGGRTLGTSTTAAAATRRPAPTCEEASLSTACPASNSTPTPPGRYSSS